MSGGYLRTFTVRLTRAAQRDVKAALDLSRREFGLAAFSRYRALIKQALRDIGQDPERPGSMERPEFGFQSLRTYHIANSRSRIAGPTVKTPRHFLAYRMVNNRQVEVIRILHDARDLDAALSED